MQVLQMCCEEEAEILGPPAASASHCGLQKMLVCFREQESAQIKRQAVRTPTELLGRKE